MIVRQRPEDGHGADATLAQLAGHPDRIERFYDREERTGEEADLMAGEDGDGAPAGEIFGRLRRGGPAMPESGGGRAAGSAEKPAPAFGCRIQSRPIRIELRSARQKTLEELRQSRIAIERDKRKREA